MAQIYELVQGRKTLAVDVEHSVLEAARFMTENNVGAVPVLRDGELVGIFSERDLMRRVVAAGRSPGLTKVAEVMTANPRTVAANESVENCLFLMQEHGFRRLSAAHIKSPSLRTGGPHLPVVGRCGSWFTLPRGAEGKRRVILSELGRPRSGSHGNLGN